MAGRQGGGGGEQKGTVIPSPAESNVLFFCGVASRVLKSVKR